MKRLFLIFYLLSFLTYSQKFSVPFKGGEYLKYKLSYGPVNAGIATLKIENHFENKTDMLHVIGKGWTTGMTNFFFSVKDNYETYFDKNQMKPFRFIRKIDEGGYTKDKEILFDFNDYRATVIDHKMNKKNSFSIEKDVQDMLSSLYYVRNIDFTTLKEGDIISIKMFLDSEIYRLNLIIKEREVIKFNKKKIKTIVLQPTVQEGRIFKSNESVTFWISDDLNKVPLKIKASILVGSIKAELIEYKGLSNPMTFIFN